MKRISLLSIIVLALLVGCIFPEPLNGGTTQDDEIPCPQELIDRVYTHDTRYGAYVLKGYREPNGNVVTCTTDGTYLYCKPFLEDEVLADFIFISTDQEEIPERPNPAEPQTFIVEYMYCEEFIKATVVITGGSNPCDPGECYSNGHCCLASTPYYCEGACYASQSAAMSASQGRCSSHKTIC